MRIGELSSRTGVSVPTIKYYLREGLLPPGELSLPNQADYTAEHERRLRLIRALIEVGKVSVGTVRDVVQAVADPERPVHKALGVVQTSISRTLAAKGGGATDGAEAIDPDRRAAVELVTELVRRRGWPVTQSDPSVLALVEALASMRRLGYTAFEQRLDVYASATESIAEADVAGVGGMSSTTDIAEAAVIGTLLGDSALAALRRLAQQDASARWFGAGGPG
ncbi:MerR family transcriptional regulator, partial [Streptomyces sparsus]